MVATTGAHIQARTLLVVADNAETQTVILEHARAQGHSVISASSPALGLSTFDMTKPDIVITDLFLPEQDGVMLVKQIHERCPTCPVLPSWMRTMALRTSLPSSPKMLNRMDPSKSPS